MALLIGIALELLVVHEGSCSNIQVTNPTLGTLSSGSTTVTFDVTWTNSWRHTGGGAPAPNNWDAAWVFVKFRKNGGDWAHASLNNTGHSTGSGTAATISVGYPDTSSSFIIQHCNESRCWSFPLPKWRWLRHLCNDRIELKLELLARRCDR